MTEVTENTLPGAAVDLAEPGSEILRAMDERYDDPEYMAEMDATGTNLAHEAGTAETNWDLAPVAAVVHDTGSSADGEDRPGAPKDPATATSMVSAVTTTVGAFPPVEQIPLHLLRLDVGAQEHANIYHDVVTEYANALRSEENLPPVVVFSDGIDFWLADGFQSYHAHVAIKALEIPGIVHEGTLDDALAYAARAAHDHGLPRPNADQAAVHRPLHPVERTLNPILRIDPELQAWIDPLSPAELAGLETSLLEEGCRDPLVVWAGWLLDGHNRYALCTKHGIAFQTVEKTGLVTKADAMLWMIDHQLGKRNLTDFARVALALNRKPLIEAQAKARMLAGQADPRQNSDEGPVRTDESIAKAAGVSRDTVRKVEKIIEKAGAEVIDQVRSGELSIHAAAKTVTPPKAKPAGPTMVADMAAEPRPEVATPRLPPAQGAVAVTDVEALVQQLAERDALIAELREELDGIKADMAETLADNDRMARVFDADDQVKASMAEVARFKALAEHAERTLHARSHEFNERARSVKYWKNRAEKAEKQLATTG